MKRKGAMVTRRSTKRQSTDAPKKHNIFIETPISIAISHVDSLLDRIRQDKLKSMDESHLAQLRKLPAADLKRVGGQYVTTLEGMKRAVAGDAYDREVYSNFTKDQMKVAVEYLKALKALKHDESSNGKMSLRVKGATRQKKHKEPEQIVAKVLYLAKDEETGLTSENPAKLVGASEMWIYNTKLRKLGMYIAATPDGLSAKGTTVLNYNEKESFTKTLRKPEIQMRQFVAGGTISWMRAFWKSIKSVPQNISPRLSRETIIVKTHS